MQDKNLAYDFSLFEENPREYTREHKRKNNVVRIPKEKLKQNAKSKVNILQSVTTAILCVISVAVITIMVHNQVVLTELTEQVNSASKSLDENKNIYTQLCMNMESRFSLSNVEECAKNEFNMKRIEPYQIQYISLSNGDKGEIIKNNENNFFSKLKASLCNVLS